MCRFFIAQFNSDGIFHSAVSIFVFHDRQDERISRGTCRDLFSINGYRLSS
nr:MAG TPA: hypothetical protein [Caudoviricetes sp.]